MIYLVLVIILLAGLIGYTVNYIQSVTEEDSSLFRPIDDSILCSSKKEPHKWGLIKLITNKELDAYEKNPTTFNANTVPDTQICSSCGYMPKVNKMLNAERLHEYKRALAKQEATKISQDRYRKMVFDLRDEFIERYLILANQSKESSELIREGFKAYDLFMDALPELMAKREAEEIVKLVKSLPKGESNAKIL